MTNLWEEILARIETKVNRHSFYTWFRPTTFVTDDRTSVTVRVPNGLFKDWLTKHYSGVINEAMSELKRPNLTVQFLSDSPSDSPTVPLGPEHGAPSRPSVDATVPGSAGLNPRYSFDTFIVGSSNQFAHAACRAVAEAPSRSYNPLFIYGGVGLGKTHLMHAVGQYVLRHDRNRTLTYISAERFMNEMINAVRYDRIIDFRERYRTLDVLLVDDVQFIAGKEATQTEFFHTFNALYDSQKQIVISSDWPPHEIHPTRGAAALPVRVGIDRGHSAAGPRDQGRDSQEEGGRRGRAASRQRRDLYRWADQVEHPRARRVADSPDCVCLADGPGNHPAARAGSVEERPGTRREERSRSR